MFRSHAREVAVGQRIAAIRGHRLMTQAELAVAAGTSRHVISKIENGHTRHIDVDQTERIAKALFCVLDDLLAPLDAPMPRYRNNNNFSGATLVPVYMDGDG
jgi:transcriptional regulator with XRE-family HTH domain